MATVEVFDVVPTQASRRISWERLSDGRVKLVDVSAPRVRGALAEVLATMTGERLNLACEWAHFRLRGGELAGPCRGNVIGLTGGELGAPPPLIGAERVTVEWRLGRSR